MPAATQCKTYQKGKQNSGHNFHGPVHRKMVRLWVGPVRLLVQRSLRDVKILIVRGYYSKVTASRDNAVKHKVKKCPEAVYCILLAVLSSLYNLLPLPASPNTRCNMDFCDKTSVITSHAAVGIPAFLNSEIIFIIVTRVR